MLVQWKNGPGGGGGGGGGYRLHRIWKLTRTLCLTSNLYHNYTAPPYFKPAGLNTGSKRCVLWKWN